MSAQGPNGTQTFAKNTNGNGNGGLIGGSTIMDLLQGGGLPSFYLTPTFGISAGTYTVTAPGGKDVGAITASIDVSSSAAAFKWTNQSSVATSSIDRTQPLTITWTGGDPNGFVDITGIASTATASSGPVAGVTPGNLVECLVPASAGKFTIPAFVLEALAEHDYQPIVNSAGRAARRSSQRRGESEHHAIRSRCGLYLLPLHSGCKRRLEITEDGRRGLRKPAAVAPRSYRLPSRVEGSTTLLF